MSKGNKIKPATSKNIEIKSDILNSEELQNELTTLKELFEASYGPTGRTSLIQHVSGGHVTVTSTSSQLLKNITTVSTPLTRLLLQSVQGHLHQYNDGGLFTVLLTLQLIESSLKSGLRRHTVIEINDLALNTIVQHFESGSDECGFKLTADLGNMEQMFCVIRSIIETKPATGITKNELQSLTVLLLRGFLNCTPKYGSQGVSLDNLRIQGYEGPSFNESCLKKGILFQTNFHPVKGTTCENKKDIKVALFDCSLAGNVDDTWLEETTTELSNNVPSIEDNVLESMMRMIDELLENGVQLIACQKVIHPTLQRYMTRKGLYAIERLSICNIHVVQRLTGARLLSSCKGMISTDSFGSLNEIIPLIVHKKRYVQLIAHSRSEVEISTLLLCAPDEHSLDELKIVCTAALRALKELLYHPYLVAGAGCFETNVAALLMKTAQDLGHSQRLDCSKQQICRGLYSVASVFLHLARTIDHDDNNHLVDTHRFHHWITQPLNNDITNSQHCLCGMVTSHQDTEWYMTEELCGTSRSMCVQNVSTGKKEVIDFKNVVLDVLSMKMNGIYTAFETANTILRVKHFVKETFEM